MKSTIFKTAIAFFVLQCGVFSNGVPQGFAVQDPIDQEEQQLEQDIKQTNASEGQELNRFAVLAGEMKAGESEEAQVNAAENDQEQEDILDAEEHDQHDLDMVEDRLR